MGNILDIVAQVLYRVSSSTPDKKFEELLDPLRAKYQERARNMLTLLDQLNIMVISASEYSRMKTMATDWKQPERIKTVIDDFVKKIKHPKDVAKFFPAEELARKIMEGV